MEDPRHPLCAPLDVKLLELRPQEQSVLVETTAAAERVRELLENSGCRAVLKGMGGSSEGERSLEGFWGASGRVWGAHRGVGEFWEGHSGVWGILGLSWERLGGFLGGFKGHRGVLRGSWGVSRVTEGFWGAPGGFGCFWRGFAVPGGA